MSKPILAIDIGSSKICTIIAEQDENKSFHIMGTGNVKSNGIRKGVISNIENLSLSIKKSLLEATKIAGVEIKDATVSISGANTKSINSHALVNVVSGEITENEINRVMKGALENAKKPNGYEVIHVIPHNFTVDDQNQIEDPIGMNGSRLEVEVHVILVQKTTLTNLTKTLRSIGINVNNFVLSGYASSLAVATEDEAELGVAIADIGGSSTNIIIKTPQNNFNYNDFIPVGANHITSDLATVLKTPIEDAKELQKTFSDPDMIEQDTKEINIKRTGDSNNLQTVSTEIVQRIIQARVEETLRLIADNIKKSGLKEQLGAGIILTGGFTKSSSIEKVALRIFDIPVRVGKPINLDGIIEPLVDPVYSTVIGLLMYASGEKNPYEIGSNKTKSESASSFAESTLDFGDVPHTNKETKIERQPTQQKPSSSEQPMFAPLEKSKKTNIKNPFKDIWEKLTKLF